MNTLHSNSTILIKRTEHRSRGANSHLGKVVGGCRNDIPTNPGSSRPYFLAV